MTDCFGGSPPALQDLLGGRIDFMCEQISTAIFSFVLPVSKVLPQPQVTVALKYLGCIFSFIAVPRSQSI